MSKRQATDYLTKEPSKNWGDDEDDRDKIDPVEFASDQVMATRKYGL